MGGSIDFPLQLYHFPARQKNPHSAFRIPPSSLADCFLAISVYKENIANLTIAFE